MCKLFVLIDALMRDDESFQFSIERKNGRLTVMLAPALRAAPDNLSDQAKQARALLALPLRFEGSAEDIDTKFQQCVQGFGDVRRELGTAFDALIDEMKEGAKAARQRPAPGARPPAKPSAPAAPKPIPDSTDDEDDVEDEEADKSPQPPPRPPTPPPPPPPPAAATTGNSLNLFETPA